MRPLLTQVQRELSRLKAKYNDLLLEVTDIPKDEKDKLISNVKAMRIIRFAYQPTRFA